MADAFTPPSAMLANLSMLDVAQNPDTESPNAMALDTDDTHVIQPNGMADKDSVAEIPPEALAGEADQPSDQPLATDCTSPHLRPLYPRRCSHRNGVEASLGDVADAVIR